MRHKDTARPRRICLFVAVLIITGGPVRISFTGRLGVLVVVSLVVMVNFERKKNAHARAQPRGGRRPVVQGLVQG